MAGVRVHGRGWKHVLEGRCMWQGWGMWQGWRHVAVSGGHVAGGGGMWYVVRVRACGRGGDMWKAVGDRGKDMWQRVGA